MEAKTFSENNLSNPLFMKVLYLIDSLEGYGAERSLVEIAININGIQPVFVHLYNGSALRPVLEEQGIKVYSLNIDSKYAYSKAVELLIPVMEIEKPKIIHSTLFRADMIARKLKHFFPQVLLVGSLVSNSYGRSRYGQLSLLAGLKLFLIQIKDRRTTDKVDFFISNSHTIKNTNSRALSVPHDKIKVIYRGRSMGKSGAGKSKKLGQLSRDLGLAGKKVFLNVGRLHQGKGQADLLQAFKPVSETFEDALLLIAGEGSYRIELERIISDLGLQEKVQLLGYREDVEDILAVADYFVFPSYYEGLPGALIEAIIAEKPLVISDIGENRECVPPGKALFFKPGNIKEMTAKMKEAVDIPDWQERTMSSLDHARKNFDIKKVSRQYESFYKDILKDHNPL